MEEDFKIFEMKHLETWERFKKDKIEKWILPVELPILYYKSADSFLQKILDKDRQEYKEHPKSSNGEEIDKRRGGLRGQKWFVELLKDLKIYVESEFEADLNWHDILLPNIYSTIEVKTMTFGSSDVNIKIKSWNRSPSLYIVVVKACNNDYTEFQFFVGWLYGHEVYKLRYQQETSMNDSSFLYADTFDLNGPRQMLNFLLRLSEVNPFRIHTRDHIH